MLSGARQVLRVTGVRGGRRFLSVGDTVPATELMHTKPDDKVNLKELSSGGKIIVFGVPGAFTPGCSATHLPGFVEDYDKHKAAGISKIVCVSVNDPFVMQAWGEKHQVGDKVMMVADPTGAVTSEMGMATDALQGVLGNVRSKRYSMVVEEGTVKVLNVEEDNFGLNCSLSSVLKY